MEPRLDAQFREVREGQRQIFLAIVMAGTTVTLALVGVIATLALGGGLSLQGLHSTSQATQLTGRSTLQEKTP